MFVIVFAMVVIVAAAGVLVAVMAYPNQGREVPNAPRVNQTLNTVAAWLGLDRTGHGRSNKVTSGSPPRA